MIEYKRVFLDTAPIIYYLERHPDYFEAMKAFLLHSEGKQLVTSVITVAEYCVLPFRNHNTSLIENFKNLLSGANVEIISIDQGIAETAAQIRAEYSSFKAMDAFQLASAGKSNCDLFLTNDKQLRQFSKIHCITADEL